MGKTTAWVGQNKEVLSIQVPFPRIAYLENIMRANCFEALWPLYRLAANPAKELTESYAAHRHLRNWRHPKLVLHVGDGAHARTAALFAMMTKHRNVAIDPATIERVPGAWKHKFQVERFAWAKCRIEDYPLEDITEPCLVTFVHAHVDTDEVLRRLPNWEAAYTNACCEPERQIGKMPGEHGEDWSILSPQRTWKVVVNPALHR